jgi:Muconolactone delta-isomerase
VSAERNIFTMAEFMVHATFHQQDQQNILARIPQEQEHIKLLMEQGVVQALYIASDFSGVWLVVQGDSQTSVQHHLESLPLHPYMTLQWTQL